ncbi:MAG TPA: hypothetical protein VGD01_09200 [Candidatus Elarobacter sp.]
MRRHAYAALASLFFEEPDSPLDAAGVALGVVAAGAALESVDEAPAGDEPVDDDGAGVEPEDPPDDSDAAGLRESVR